MSQILSTKINDHKKSWKPVPIKEMIINFVTSPATKTGNTIADGSIPPPPSSLESAEDSSSVVSGPEVVVVVVDDVVVVVVVVPLAAAF